MLFPFLGLATSFISMASYDDYAACVSLQTVTDTKYDDKIKLALRNYACWYYAFTLCKNPKCLKIIVYFLILYKPFKVVYKLSGVLMTLLILAGYGICISGIIFTSKSKCKSSTMGKVSVANMVIFLAIASLMLIFTHTIIWIPICKARGSAPSQVSPGVNESDKLPLN